MTEAPEDPKPDRPRRRRPLLKWAVALASIFALFLLVEAFLWLRDEAPPDVADLAVQWGSIPPSENGFYVLRRAADLLVGRDVLEETVDLLEWPDEPDPTQLRAGVPALLASNARSLELVTEAAKLRIVLPQEDAVRNPEIEDLRRLTDLLSVEFHHRMDAGDTAAALRVARLPIRLGLAVQDGGNAVWFLVGKALESTGFAHMGQILMLSDLDPKLLEEDFSEDIVPWTPDTLCRTLRVEFVHYVSVVEPLFGEYRWPTKLVMKPMRTRRILAEAIRRVIDHYDVATDNPPQPLELDKARFAPGAREVFAGTYVSDYFLTLILPTLYSHQSSDLRSAMQRNAMRLLLAIRRYYSATGVLPQTLDDLVPKYSKALPLDPYTGAPFIYSRDRRFFYSPGFDGEDVGGRPIANMDVDWYEPTYPLPFAGPVEYVTR